MKFKMIDTNITGCLNSMASKYDDLTVKTDWCMSLENCE